MTELKPVQVAALNASRGRKGFGFFMEMGLGKTLTALSEWQNLVPNGITRAVVVCPNSFKSGWTDQIKEHGIDVDAHIFESGSWSNNSWLEKKYEKPPVIIINYQAIRSADTRAFLYEYMRRKPTYIVFDESIQLKNNRAEQTKAGIEIAQYAKVSRLLSGKPQSQGPHDLWGQMQAIYQQENRNYYAFKAMFCRMGGFKNKKVIGIQNEDILARLIEPHIFRANKDKWGFDIPKMFTIREYEMATEQRRQYKSMERDFVLWLSDTEVVTIEAMITKYEKLAQIQAGFIIDEDGKTHDLISMESNPRIRVIRDIMEDEITGKLIVVYTHRYSYELLSRSLVEYNPAFIKGGMASYEVSEQKVKFNEDPSCRMILVQEQSGKYGHTLIGGPEPINRCSTMAFFENSYSLDDRSQIEDRPHRWGQLNDSVLYIDLCATPLDKNVARSLQQKESMYKAVFSLIKEAVPA